MRRILPFPLGLIPRDVQRQFANEGMKTCLDLLGAEVNLTRTCYANCSITTSTDTLSSLTRADEDTAPEKDTRLQIERQEGDRVPPGARSLAFCLQLDCQSVSMAVQSSHNGELSRDKSILPETSFFWIAALLSVSRLAMLFGYGHTKLRSFKI